MASLVSLQPYPLSPFPGRTRARARNPLSNQTHFGFCTKISSPLLRRKFTIVGLGPSGDFLDFEAIEGFAHKLFDRAEGIVYTIADASVSPTDTAIEGSSKTGDWLSGITNYMETVLKVLKDGLSALHVPYAYGFAIILLTVLVKAATFPLTKKQVESALAMRSLQPQVKAIQERYAGDPERIQLETARLYKLAGVNPLAGCLPTLATIPIWIGLYRALSNVTDEGLLTGGFFWIPSLAGPTTVAARQSGSGISWLFPFVDGHPPLGWSDTLAYLVLPVLLVVSQYISAQIIQPSQSGDPGQKSFQAVTKLLPLMIGYFALSVPSGLSLYWFTNNILSTAQQIWLQKLGGAKNLVKEYNDKKIRGEPSNIQKSISDIEKFVLPIETIEKPSQEDKANSGLRPGERFKQLKEQEARRRKQREEEEKRKDEEAVANFPITIEHQHLEVEPLEDSGEQGSERSQTKQREENRNEEGTDITTEHQNMGAESSEGKPEQVSEESRTKLNMSAANNGGLNSTGCSAVKDKESIHKDN